MSGGRCGGAVAQCSWRSAGSDHQQGRGDEAVEFKENALAIGRRVPGEDDEGLRVYMGNLANTYRALGRHEDALAMQESALSFFRRELQPNHPHIGQFMNKLATTYSDLRPLSI